MRSTSSSSCSTGSSFPGTRSSTGSSSDAAQVEPCDGAGDGFALPGIVADRERLFDLDPVASSGDPVNDVAAPLTGKRPGQPHLDPGISPHLAKLLPDPRAQFPLERGVCVIASKPSSDDDDLGVVVVAVEGDRVGERSPFPGWFEEAPELRKRMSQVV